MGIYDYLKSWDIPTQSGDARKSASGADSSGQVDGADYDGGVAYRWPMPETEEWGIGDKGQSSGGYGHSEACKDVGGKDTAWGMSQADIARGYEGPEKYDDGQFNQDIPSTNERDRGAGSDSYAREHSATTGRGFDGTGTTKNRSGLGSMTIRPGNTQD